MFTKNVIVRFAALCLVGLLSTEAFFPLQISGQNLSLFQNQFSNAENFDMSVFPGKQEKETRIVEIRRPENKTEFNKLPKISEKDLRKLVSGGDVRVVTDKTIAASVENDRKTAAKNREEFARVFARRPDLLKLFLKDKSDPNPTITLQNGKTYMLLNDDTMIDELLLMNKYVNDPKNQAKNYTHLYTKFQQQLPSVPKATANKFRALPTAQQVSGFSLEKINSTTAQLVALWLEFDHFRLSQPFQDKEPPACKDEEGTGNGGDSGGTCGAVNPNGLRARINWPLENKNTCVRDQGRRGTCTAFGISAGVESSIAENYRRYINLSEQNLYKKQMLTWSSPSNYYGDGFNTVRSIELQVEHSYKSPFEYSWNYNKSLKRCLLTTDADGNGRLDDTDPLCESEQHYRRSCVDYTDVNCSNTTHQARRVCQRADVSALRRIVNEICGSIGGIFCEALRDLLRQAEEFEVCYYSTPVPGTSGFGIQEADRFYGDGSVTAQAGVDQAKAYLAARTPVVFSTMVTGLRGATGNGGYVTYNEESVGSGGHAIMITGYVDNEDLPRGVPNGAGGGYFIIKNSWACAYGDQGYAYLPYSWVKQRGKSMIALTSVGS